MTTYQRITISSRINKRKRQCSRVEQSRAVEQSTVECNAMESNAMACRVPSVECSSKVNERASVPEWDGKKLTHAHILLFALYTCWHTQVPEGGHNCCDNQALLVRACSNRHESAVVSSSWHVLLQTRGFHSQTPILVCCVFPTTRPCLYITSTLTPTKSTWPYARAHAASAVPATAPRSGITRGSALLCSAL